MIGGRVVYVDGSVYHGDIRNNLEHGLGTLKSIRGTSLFSGRWRNGYEELGVLDENGITFAGRWSSGRRHGLGVECSDDVAFAGDWTEGAQSRYGVANYTNNKSCYKGIWVDSKPEEYGTHEYADNGTYRGQWLNGRKTGFGVRTSGQYGTTVLAIQDLRNMSSNLGPLQSMKKPTMSAHVMGFVLPVSPRITRVNVVETYRGQWVEGRRCGYGIAQRSDGHKYEGEWRDDKRHGFGVTTKTDGTKHCGRYQNGKLIMDLASWKGWFLDLIFDYRFHLDESVLEAKESARYADMKADIAERHAKIAREIGKQAYKVHEQALHQSTLALAHATQFHFADAMIGGRVVAYDGVSVYHGDFLNGQPHGLGTVKSGRGTELYAGRWTHGSEDLGTFSDRYGGYAGQFEDRKHHGLGVSILPVRTYKGEFTYNFPGPYGVATMSIGIQYYAGTWSNFKHEGYGIEVYGDGGTYRGQWLEGRCNGYGVRTSGEHGTAARLIQAKCRTAHVCLHDMGFMLPVGAHQTAGDVVETYRGQWKNGRRDGYGISERSDGFKYEGSWREDRRDGYGVTWKKDGTSKAGKWENGVCVVDFSTVKGYISYLLGGGRALAADSVASAARAAQIAESKAEIAAAHAATAHERAQQADVVAGEAEVQANLAIVHARQFHYADAG